MSHMSMNKVIHSAFRRDLDRFVAALSAFPPGDIGRAKDLGRAWKNFEHELTYHHEGEHATAWPALERVGVSPQLLREMDDEHAVMGQAIVDAGVAMSALTKTAGVQESKDALAAFQRLQEVTVRHLDHEEAELEPVYLAQQDAPAMQEMGKKFAKVSPARGGHFFAWLVDDASPEAREALGSTVPGPVIAVLTGIFGRRYRRSIATVWQH